MLPPIWCRTRVEQIREVFPETSAAEDFDRFQIKRGEVEKV